MTQEAEILWSQYPTIPLIDCVSGPSITMYIYLSFNCFISSFLPRLRWQAACYVLGDALFQTETGWEAM